MSSFGSASHLARRFVGSLSPRPPSVGDDAWVQRWLTPAQRRLWDQQSKADRRHAIEVARTVSGWIGDRDGTAVRKEIVATALLHDVGKIDAGIGTLARVVVTAVALVAGRDTVAAWRVTPNGRSADGEVANEEGQLPNGEDRVPSLSQQTSRQRSLKQRAGSYVSHDVIGARLLAEAGSAELTVAWAGEHHLPALRRTVDPALAELLAAADDD